MKRQKELLDTSGAGVEATRFVTITLKVVLSLVIRSIIGQGPALANL
jgi:hypothetical protein